MKLWGGRFSGEPDDLMRRLNDSFAFDRRLYAADIKGSIAYAGALLKAGILAPDEHDRIVEGLGRVKAEFDQDRFEPVPSDEDIHTAVERRLTDLIGPLAGKLHTGRSRNDQVALDFRLWMIDAISDLVKSLGNLQSAIVDQAETYLDLLMPGYTHLQPAQPILFSHWLMSFFWMFNRDRDRLRDCQRRTAVSPLGAGALAGNPFPIDRVALAADLGLNEVTPNSVDAVSDRDFAAEFLFCAALIGTHLGRLAEDLLIYSSPSYRFLSIGETYTTGSSLMPQKRNPDALELARGKTGRLIGDLVSLLSTLKALPSSYNKDLQEDKEPVFDATETLNVMLPVLAGVVRSLNPDSAAMSAALDEGMLATDLADYLVEHGIPFREAHHLVGRAVHLAEARGVPLSGLPDDELEQLSPLLNQGAREVFDFERAIARRAVVGGTAQAAVQQQIAQARGQL